VEQREDGRHESRLSENARNLNRRNAYGVFDSHTSCLGAYHSVFAFPPEIRRVVYTTGREVHAHRRTIIETRGHFPNDEAALKLIWLALGNINAKWERGAPAWRAAMKQFAIPLRGSLHDTESVECKRAWTLASL
jgi:transposase-like protein